MKKRSISLFAVLFLLTSLLIACSPESSSDGLTKVTLNEVAHSIFYAPMYVAIEEGYFEEEGIDLELVTGFGENLLVQNNSSHFNKKKRLPPAVKPEGILILSLLQYKHF